MIYGRNFRRSMMNNLSTLHDDRISKILSDSTQVTQIIQAGIRAALLQHKQAGNPVCEWKDNKINWVSAENIPVTK